MEEQATRGFVNKLFPQLLRAAGFRAQLRKHAPKYERMYLLYMITVALSEIHIAAQAAHRCQSSQRRNCLAELNDVPPTVT